jgi:hypothetical protein
MPLSKEQIEALSTMERWGVIRDTDGYAAGQMLLGVELYVEPRPRQQLRLDMLSAQELYYWRFQDHLDWMRYQTETEDEGKAVKVVKGRNPIPWVREVMGNIPPHNSYVNTLAMTKYRHPDFPDSYEYGITPWFSEFFVKSETSRYQCNELSYYTSTMPFADDEGKLNFEKWRDCVLDWAKILRPAHGLAGITVVMREPFSTTDGPAVYPALKRFHGLDIHTPLSFTDETDGVFDRIKCVNWLTVLGEALLEDLGGVDVLEPALKPAGCTLYPYPGGVVIQAGEAPRLGAIEVPGASELLDPYRKVAFLTKRVRFMDYKSSLFRVDPPLNGPDEARKWVSRFD